MIARGVGVVALSALIVAALLALPTDRVSDRPTPVGPAPAPAPKGQIDISARIDVTPQPLGIAVGDERVYVGHSEGRIVEEVDPTTEQVVGGIGSSDRSKAPPAHVAFGGGRVFIARSGSLESWDLGSGNAPREAELGIPDTVTDLVYGDGWVWVATSDPDDQETYKVFQFTGRGLKQTRLHPFGLDRVLSAPPHIDFGYGALWIATSDSEDALLRVDLQTGRIQSIRGIESASDVDVGAGGVWVYENSSKEMRSRILRIDPETLEVEKKATVLGYFAWLEADENGVWVLNAHDETDRRLLRLDPATGDSMGTSLRLGAGPFEMTSGFGSIWITDEGRAQVLRVDVVTELEERIQ